MQLKWLKGSFAPIMRERPLCSSKNEFAKLVLRGWVSSLNKEFIVVKWLEDLAGVTSDIVHHDPGVCA